MCSTLAELSGALVPPTRVDSCSLRKLSSDVASSASNVHRRRSSCGSTGSSVRNWVARALELVEQDFASVPETPVYRIELPPEYSDIGLYIKDESAFPTGNLKHRLAKSLFVNALSNNWLRPGVPVVESSSGNTAISEAYFARLIGVPFVAVVPKSTARRKVEAIEAYGGRCCLAEPEDCKSRCTELAAETGGHFMDQFTYAERATDWRRGNLAEAMLDQLTAGEMGEPRHIVCSAGTGGTSATIGRYMRYNGFETQLCVADPEHSVFYPYYHSGDKGITATIPTRIEGIGRLQVEASFMRDVVDRMMRVPDASSIAAAHWASAALGRKVGGSTGTNVWAALQLVEMMRSAGSSGSVATILCDKGERYSESYYNQSWIDAHLNREAFDDELARLTRCYGGGGEPKEGSAAESGRSTESGGLT